MFESFDEHRQSDFPVHFSRKHDFDDFGMPEDSCPKRIETPKFPSPNSCLSPIETEELEARIAVANRLLLDLGLSGELDIEGRRRAFDGLLGRFIRVYIDCEAEVENEEPAILISNKTITATKAKTKRRVVSRRKRSNVFRKNLRKAKLVKRSCRCWKTSTGPKRFIEGYVKLVGQDFAVLVCNQKDIIVKLRNVVLIKTNKSLEVEGAQPELLDIDPCLRRALTFNFGETVASSPGLIHIFYRLTFAIYLLLLQGEKVKVKLDEEVFTGTVLEVHRESLTIEMEKAECREIPLEKICLVKSL